MVPQIECDALSLHQALCLCSRPRSPAEGDGEEVLSSNFIVDLGDFAAFLLNIVVPWSAINLVDYYFVRRGHLQRAGHLVDRRTVWLFNIKAVAIVLIGTAVEVPFMNASWPKFEGPVAKSMGGADISWLIGFAVAGIAYYVASRADGRWRKGCRRRTRIRTPSPAAWMCGSPWAPTWLRRSRPRKRPA